ncbi:serine/threonine-protein kinase [Myxococcus sp. K15C18031901]|uniref:serine/threonine-protein kinase n=1 Tax=Myxococcus dinghuensis TaxID=2906761 RepID=UPI0020A7D397|nr:serine/threonine-protein kinase [Myxococcus dinghuensis]MCP3102477.1 serine/threonine-protein kinase [Myxococcus dinghuensis]
MTSKDTGERGEESGTQDLPRPREAQPGPHDAGTGTPGTETGTQDLPRSPVAAGRALGDPETGTQDLPQRPLAARALGEPETGTQDLPQKGPDIGTAPRYLGPSFRDAVTGTQDLPRGPRERVEGTEDLPRSGRDAGTGPSSSGSRSRDTGTGPELERRDAPPLSQVGRYLLLKQLGEGGMGVVYAAYDPDLDRKVALKLLHPGKQHDAEDARARLLREAQAMARVSHPNVIPVFDVGMWGDQVFVAMELVDGGTLSSWLKSGQRSWREILERYIAAGRGLEAAHAAGLVHRDFKPANVLVSRAGRVYVTDFGLARPVGDLQSDVEEPTTEEARLLMSSQRRMLDTTLTEHGLVVGTPNYMSPEQFRGATLDGRTDQFSFCAALYGALYGVRPFDPGSVKAYVFSTAPATAEKHTESLGAGKDTAKPGVLGASPLVREPPREVKVPGWVRDAVLKGLSLEAAGRYPSMGALLDALSQEHRRFQRRRQSVAVGLLGGALALTAGAVWQQSRVCVDAGALMDAEWSPAKAEQLTSAFGATNKPFAANVAANVTRVLGDYADAWKAQRVQACEATRVQGVKPEEQLDRQLVCLERRRKDFHATVELLSGADAAVVEKSLDAALALPALAECDDEEGLAQQQRRPADPLRRATLDALEEKLSAVRAQMDAGRYPPALDALKPLLAPMEETGYLPLVAEAHFAQGWLMEQLGDSPGASRMLARAVFDAEAGHADRLKVAVLNKLLFVEDGLEHFEPAARWGELAEATLTRLGGDPVLLGDVRVNQANLALTQDHTDEAKARLEEAGALYARSLPPQHPKRARTTFLLARVLHTQGDSTRALALMNEALQQTTAAVGPLHPDVARRHGMLSWTLRELKRDAEALPHARAAADIVQALYGEDSPQFAEMLDEVGMCQLGMGRYAEALGTYERSLALKRKALPADDEKLQPSLDGVGQALLGLGKARESVEPLRAAVGFASAPPDALAESGFALARALYQTGQAPQARGEATRARGWFTEAGLDARVVEVDTFLSSLPEEKKPRPPRPPPRTRRR